jgi:hypothetical protein
MKFVVALADIRTTQLYDRRSDAASLDEYSRWGFERTTRAGITGHNAGGCVWLSSTRRCKSVDGVRIRFSV